MKVTYIDHMGTDLSVVNAARVSFGKKSKWVDNPVWGISNETGEPYWISSGVVSSSDKGLIRFLARGCTTGDWENLVNEITKKGMLQSYDGFAVYPVTEEECEKLDLELRELLTHIRRMPAHWTPFGHTAITLHFKAPIFVARQLGKHQVGMVWNEVSRRYVTDEPEFYFPEVWRRAADNVKQGSSDESVDPRDLWTSYADVEMDPGDIIHAALMMYNRMVRPVKEGGLGVCPEQARMVLPQSMYTEWYWTGNLYSFANVFIQRTDSHAQREVQVIAKQIGEIIEPLFPVSWEALTS